MRHATARCLSLALLAGVLLTVQAQACEKESTNTKSTTASAAKSTAVTASSCSGAASSTAATTADLDKCSTAAHANSCCGMKSTKTTTAKNATTAKSPSQARAASATAATKSTAKKATAKPATSTSAKASPATAGVMAIIDPTTGGLARPTAEQLTQLAQSSKSAGFATSAVGAERWEVVQLPDGTMMARVPESFMMNAVAHRDADGKIKFDCRHDQAAPATAATPAAAPASAPAPWETK